jgi:hypothetical protein
MPSPTLQGKSHRAISYWKKRTGEFLSGAQDMTVMLSSSQRFHEAEAGGTKQTLTLKHFVDFSALPQARRSE